MKKFLLALATACFLSTTAFAAGDMILPPPTMNDKLSVMDALKQRQSSRNFVDKNLSPAQMSKILWAAGGINRDDGKRTVPAALGVYSVEIYAVTKEGIFLYDVKSHKLTLIAEGDFRSTTTTGQKFASKAALNLVYVETPEVWRNSKRQATRDAQVSFANVLVGAMIQNVALAAETEGLGNCVRGSVDREKFREAAKLSEGKLIILAQSVGYTK